MVGLLDPAYLAVWKLMQQVALLSQKGRVMLEYFATSPTLLSVSPYPLKLYIVPFLRYAASKNVVILKPGVGLVQGD